MDYELFSSFPLLLSLFTAIIAILFKVLKNSKAKNKSTLNLPPGPRKLPLIGNLHNLAGSPLPHYVFRDLALKYGPVMLLQLGEVNTLVITSREAAKEVLRTHDINFANRPSLLASEVICYNNADIAFAPYGEYWRHLRRICTLELLSAKRVRSFKSIREEEFSNLCGWLKSSQGTSIDLTGKIFLAVCDVVTRASIGGKTNQQAKFISVVRECVEVASGFSITDLYPSVRLFRRFSQIRFRVERLQKESDKILSNIIDQHKIASGAEDNVDECNKEEDLVDVLLKCHNSGGELYLTMDSIKAVLMDLFSAGIETSSTTADWAMVEMLRNQRVMKKAQDEVRQVFDEKGMVDETCFDQLNYLKLVIKETLRLHPPVPLLLPRESREPCELNGYNIPAKTRLFINMWALNRDPKYWKEAEIFKPERYLDRSYDFSGNSFEYLPFGGGRRICPGMSFGLATVEYLLALFLYHFDWALPEGMKPDEMDMTETFGATSRRKNPLCVIPIVKRTLPLI